ncbi:putarive CRISPR-associated protein, DevR (Cas7) family [Candidatus Nitrososphaera gargensis Ga9.2]|uniref:Putarive CRISPR-associated protein, DevR (Cas7) family n=1 Tax=Nitrososphaera gargensis (strain Ga9.2) TaxID=1237085 RepID=K0ILT7_NITGG|nr:type I-B CRISPR-associated protein Cas7/Cst2/DevR [Candidatus Nitrososphaera gargensis]AFU57334.1 putarive CRISPR-associated protein, DevR (Cas7) family [Candidatus Nitrososphaera gargensis Ga9.2]
MGKVVQISILAKIVGNVNADEVIGNRATLKKMYSSDGEVLPFVSARAIKFAIREALRQRSYDIDPYQKKGDQLLDSGNPVKYIDNDLFGYMHAPKKEEGQKKGVIALRRQAPIAISYLKSLRNTPIKSEFAARFPRTDGDGENPVPFEIEVAEFIGRLNCLIYEYVGLKSSDEKKEWELKREERNKRIKDFLEILLTPTYVLPRRTNSLNIPEYYVSLVTLSERGPLPIYQYLDYVNDKTIMLSIDMLNLMMSRPEIRNNIKEAYLIDYHNALDKPVNGFSSPSLSDAIGRIISFLQ